MKNTLILVDAIFTAAVQPDDLRSDRRNRRRDREGYQELLRFVANRLSSGGGEQRRTEDTSLSLRSMKGHVTALAESIRASTRRTALAMRFFEARGLVRVDPSSPTRTLLALAPGPLRQPLVALGRRVAVLDGVAQIAKRPRAARARPHSSPIPSYVRCCSHLHGNSGPNTSRWHAKQTREGEHASSRNAFASFGSAALVTS